MDGERRRLPSLEQRLLISEVLLSAPPVAWTSFTQAIFRTGAKPDTSCRSERRGFEAGTLPAAVPAANLGVARETPAQ